MSVSNTLHDLEQLKFPIGKFKYVKEITEAQFEGLVRDIELLPTLLRKAVEGLADDQLDTPYRPGGWTVRQVVHHVADSHINAFLRFKFALTEDKPTIRPYDQDAWAHMPDSMQLPVEISLDLIENLHARWIHIIRSLDKEKFQRVFVHPVNGETTLDKQIGMYSWHGKHHTAHITSLRQRMGW